MDNEIKELVDKCELFLLSLNKENNNSYYHSEEIATYVGRLRSELRCYTLRRYNVMRTIIRHIESLNRININ